MLMQKVGGGGGGKKRWVLGDVQVANTLDNNTLEVSGISTTSLSSLLQLAKRVCRFVEGGKRQLTGSPVLPSLPSSPRGPCNKYVSH